MFFLNLQTTLLNSFCVFFKIFKQLSSSSLLSTVVVVVVVVVGVLFGFGFVALNCSLGK